MPRSLPGLLVSINLGCWVVDRESWSEFLERKGEDPDTELIWD